MWQSMKNWYHLGQAILAVAINFYPARKLTVIGVTGTDGKTTTSSMLYHILESAGQPAGLISTVGAKIGGQTIEIGLHVTTPSPFTLQKLLSQMVAAGCKYAVVEVTSHGLDQNRLFGCNFQVGVLTNITHEHLDYHGSFAAYAKAKAKLFASTKIAILNADGPWIDEVAKFPIAGKRLTYGLAPTADINSQTMSLTPSLPGEYNLANALGAAAVAKELGITDDVIQSAVETFGGVEGRFEHVKIGQPFEVVVDFAHTPNATEQVLSTLRTQAKGRVIAMFGSAGLRDKTKRPITGEVAARLADISIITADDPATEDVNQIIAQIVPGSQKAGAVEKSQDEVKQLDHIEEHVYVVIPDRKEAIAFAMTIAKPNDIVALLSKGHQKSFSQGKAEIPWNEKELAEQALRKAGY